MNNDSEAKKFDIQPFLTDLDNLANMKINTLGDKQNFYFGVNNLASQITSDSHLRNDFQYLLDEVSYKITAVAPASSYIQTPDFTENYYVTVPKPLSSESFDLKHGLTNILGYGQEIENLNPYKLVSPSGLNTKFLIDDTLTIQVPNHSNFQTDNPWSSFQNIPDITSQFVFTPQQVNIETILLEIPQIKDDLEEVKKEAKKEVAELKENIKELKEDNKRKDERESTNLEIIKKLQDDIQGMGEAIKNLKKHGPQALETLVIGPLKYENHSIYYDGSRIAKLQPQHVKICKLLMGNPDRFVSYETIKEIMSIDGYATTINMQKAISKVRGTLKESNRLIEIKSIDNKGYIFILKNIL